MDMAIVLLLGLMLVYSRMQVYKYRKEVKRHDNSCSIYDAIMTGSEWWA